MQAGKPVFKTVFYFFVISVALFALDGFSHTVLDKMSCSHSTHMIERKEPSTDQRSLSGRSKLSGIKSLFNFCTCVLQASRLVITCAYLVFFFFWWLLLLCNINEQRSEFQIKFKCASVTFGHLEPRRSTSPVEGTVTVQFWCPPGGLDHISAHEIWARLNHGWILSESTCGGKPWQQGNWKQMVS